jgi:hypothetical protein
VSRPPRRGALVGGLAATAAAVYVGATVLGGLLDPGYSHVAMHVSELTSSHASNRAFLAALYVGYNLALAGVGLALLRSVLRTRAMTVASASLVLTAAVGILLVTWFPQDSYGHPATTAGAVHIALAGVAALLGIVAMIAAGRAFRRDERWAPLARLSVWAAIVMVGTGAVGAAATAVSSPLMGLLQRLSIGTFLLWLLMVARFGLQRPRSKGADPVLVPVAGRRSA